MEANLDDSAILNNLYLSSDNNLFAFETNYMGYVGRPLLNKQYNYKQRNRHFVLQAICLQGAKSTLEQSLSRW